MFVQVIRGKVTDASEMQAAAERWQRDVAPGAAGFLGSTVGVTADNELVACARFESPDAAKRNSERPQQDSWWTETSKLFSGEVTFYDCPDVDEGLGGGSDDAGFVQVMISRVADAAEARKFGPLFSDMAKSARPDLMGYVDCYTTDGMNVTVSYFTSEAEAREAEKKEMPAEFQEAFEKFGALISDTEFFDLRDPWFFTP